MQSTVFVMHAETFTTSPDMLFYFEESKYKILSIKTNSTDLVQHQIFLATFLTNPKILRRKLKA